MQGKKMEIHGQLNVRVMLWYKSVSLLLLKCVRTVTVPLLQAEKKKLETAVFKRIAISFLCKGFLGVFLSGPSFSSLSIDTTRGNPPLVVRATSSS